MWRPWSKNNSDLELTRKYLPESKEKYTEAVKKWAQWLHTIIKCHCLVTMTIGILVIVDVVLTAEEVFKWKGEHGKQYSTHFTGSSRKDDESPVWPALPFAVA